MHALNSQQSSQPHCPRALPRPKPSTRTRRIQIVCFPCNQFGGQEPGTNAEIKAFAADKFGFEGAGVNLMDKIDVNGANTSPVWQFLKENFPGDVSWNFAAKFIIDKEVGWVVGIFLARRLDSV